MATLVFSRPAARPAGRRLLLLLGVLLAFSLGCWRIVDLSRPVSDPQVLTAGGVSYSVTHVEQVTGLSDEDLSGMGHGIQGLVSQDKALIRVSMVVRSGSASRRYDPSVLTIVDAAGGAQIAPAGGSLSQGGLGAHAQVEGSLAFIVARNGHHFSLHAPHNANAIDLLSVDQAPAGADTHQHGATPNVSIAPTAKPTTHAERGTQRPAYQPQKLKGFSS